jgi:hypothetical protein
MNTANIALGTLMRTSAYVQTLAATMVVPALLGLSGSVGQARKGATASLIVAVSRPVGLLPIARFTGSTWINTWAQPEDDGVPVPGLSDIPTSWLGQAAPRDWTLWGGDGATSKIRVAGTARERGCSGSIVLTPDHSSELPEGVAVNTEQPVEPVVTLNNGSSEWRHVEPAIATAFRENQQRIVDGTLHEYSTDSEERRVLLPVLSRSSLAGVPITIDWMHRQHGVVYFEAHKAAAASLWQLQGLSVRGWLIETATGQWRAIRVAGDLVTSASNGLGASSRVPLGSLRLGRRIFWVSALYGYESLAYAIDEVTPSDVREIIAVSAGGC